MKANCVNVLNKTVNEVCLLENKVNTNIDDIQFLYKYINFNNKLQLANLGCKVQICSCVIYYSIDNCFVYDHLLRFFLYGILDYLNSLNKENYYILARSKDDVPELWRDFNYSFPSVIQIGLIECDNCSLTNIIDSTKSQDFNPISKVINYLNDKYCNVSSYILAIFQVLAKQPDINICKCFKKPIENKQICEAFNELQKSREETKSGLCKSLNEYDICIKLTSILNTIIYYINKATLEVNKEYKIKSFNDPFYPKPSNCDILIKARDLFLEDKNICIDNCGRLVDCEPAEPGEPGEPSEPGENLYIINNRMITDDVTSSQETNTLVEEKIKKLLELTETETDYQ